MKWIPLHVYSQYSILDSTVSVEELVDYAARAQMPALALTDQGNLFGAVEFFKACKAAKINPILGCELSVAPLSRSEKRKVPGLSHGFPIVLLVKNGVGYRNLCRLSSLAYLEGFYFTPRIDKELLAAHSEGLICLSGSLEGSIAQMIIQGKEEELRKEIAWYWTLFQEDYYFELQRHRMSQEEITADAMDKEPWLHQQYLAFVQSQEKVVQRLMKLSKELKIAAVATHPFHYLERRDWRAHEILINIQSGEPCEVWEKDSFGNPKNRVLNPKRRTAPSHAFACKSGKEMEALFADCPEALATSLEIGDKCNFEIDFNRKYYPVFIPPHLEGKKVDPTERLKAAEEFLRQLCEEGIIRRYDAEALERVGEKYPLKDPLQIVRERLAYELEIIISKGMCDYLLIVYDFIAWAKRQGIPMGPGRGSGAGSIILYLIGITDIEPLRFNLFFERFINPERISSPDIDVDICMERRNEVIDYTVRKYGKDKVAQIITFGTMKAKMAIKDVGRVLNIPLAQVNALSKLIPEDVNMTLDKALEIDPELRRIYETDAQVQQLIDIAKRLEGSIRNTGIHAAGLIISADPIMERIPVCTAKDADFVVTQYSMKPVEAVGMLKIDFLGLKTLTSIQSAVNAIERNSSIKIAWANLPLEDQEVFAILNQGKTMGIFQLESPGMRDLAKQIHIDRFEEIIAVVALYRPGPMEMIPPFVQRKHRREIIEIDHPLMAEVLAETYGIMVYQEQVMQIASLLANYTLGEGDVLRRAMGKKDREEMAKQREKFRIGAEQKGIDSTTAMRIFDKIEKFASYGFNKSHAAAYAYLTYVTAYLKVHYPKEWMAALMTSDREDVAKVAKIICECRAMGIAILPPDVNESGREFVATAKGIRFALTAIKGVGEGVVGAILEERMARGCFKNLYDFIVRIDTKKTGKKVVENLIEAGCFDFTGWSRAALLSSVEPMHEEAVKEQQERALGILDLFSLLGETKEKRFSTPPSVAESSRQQLLRREHELLGFYLTGHPLDDFQVQMHRLSCLSLGKLAELPPGTVCRSAFIIEEVQSKISAKNQKKFAILTISDGIDRYELPIWADFYEAHQSLIVEQQLLYAVLQVNHEEGQLRLQCKHIVDLHHVDEEVARKSDAVYDQLRAISETKPKGIAKETKKKENYVLKLILDSDSIRFTQILELKDIFRKYGGTTPLELTFMAGQEKIGLLSIDAAWGIDYSPSLEGTLRTLPYIKGIQLVS